LPKRKSAATLILAFVRMGGESRPWGVALGPPNKPPKIWTVPEARDRELVGGMIEAIASALLEHMGHPTYRGDQAKPLLPHVWLPNASHVEMLHFLAFAYTFATRGEPARMKTLNALGRAANWLFQESTRPGQLSCIDASRALRDAFTFPAEDVRQAHTGYLLAWLETNGGINARLREATAAERLTVSTSLDPQVEKAGLDDAVEAFNVAKRIPDTEKVEAVTERIRQALEPELRRRFEITARAYRLLVEDEREANPGLTGLEKSAHERHDEYLKVEQQLARGERAWIRSPETERNSLDAASRFITLEADHGVYLNALVHHDEDMQEDLLIDGDGIRGKIIDIQFPSEGGSKRAIWILEEDSQHPLRVRPGTELIQAGYPSREAELLEVQEHQRGRRRFVLEITAGLREGPGPLGRPPRDSRWRGKTVTFLSLPDPGFAVRRRTMLWDREGPGTWLTHPKPWDGRASEVGEDDLDVDAGGT
jgi:hypothetical protein